MRNHYKYKQYMANCHHSFVILGGGRPSGGDVRNVDVSAVDMLIVIANRQMRHHHYIKICYQIYFPLEATIIQSTIPPKITTKSGNIKKHITGRPAVDHR